MKRGVGSLEEFYRGVEDGYYALDQHLIPPPGMAGIGDEEIPNDDVSEMPEDSDSFLDNQILQASNESPELPVNCQIPRGFQTSHHGSEISDMADVFDVFEGPGLPGLPGLPEQLVEAHQSDDETVTNDDPRTSIDLFSIPGSPSPSPSPPPPPPAVIRLFDGATKQWIAQQNSDASSEPPGSSAETAISVNSDDEFDMIFTECKSESSGSSPPAALNELRLIPDEKPIKALKDDNSRGRFPATPIHPRDRYPVTSIPRDRFAADRERVLNFWG
ncbi:uncharacterized protein LDX57_000863 [Aspergillus melleus]|uniref:uncharacterized protein n=1 Tax=Aspergillus melleus TaxID=138277 RepID=UPI001E8CE6D2|nr:uncharacterized protein LDX57_000863 [Aspergillus melleus]KAH8423107.1 hypothetical protein LDX57_000863 [Aspergillus melleus]